MLNLELVLSAAELMLRQLSSSPDVMYLQARPGAGGGILSGSGQAGVMYHILGPPIAL